MYWGLPLPGKATHNSLSTSLCVKYLRNSSSGNLMFEIRLIVRTAHLLAAAVWVGGSILYLVVILPALRIGGSAPEVYSQIATLFRRTVNICVGVLLLSEIGRASCRERA